MHKATHNFIPVLTSEAGASLTSAQWLEAKTQLAAFNLDSLLLKPGFDVLKESDDLSAYLGWSGQIILNASALRANRDGLFTLKSPFDGSTMKMTSLQLKEIMQQLQPELVLLPLKMLQDLPSLWDAWDEKIIPFIAAEELLKQEVSWPHGVYFHWDGSWTQEAFIAHLEKWHHLPRYVFGRLSLDFIRSLYAIGINYIESDEPAALGMEGQVYTQQGTINLLTSDNELEFELIDKDCICPTCMQQFSKAYLHHLYLHTPLLCQRFLIQHNIHLLQTFMGK